MAILPAFQIKSASAYRAQCETKIALLDRIEDCVLLIDTGADLVGAVAQVEIEGNRTFTGDVEWAISEALPGVVLNRETYDAMKTAPAFAVITGGRRFSVTEDTRMDADI